MRFAIAMTDIEGTWDALDSGRQQEILAAHERLKAELRAAGKYVDALHYHPRSEAKTVRMHADGSLTTSDGPFSQAPEYVGGIYVIDADSMDEAVSWAQKARFMIGANEVRQIWE
jgi:hypothetical protein